MNTFYTVSYKIIKVFIKFKKVNSHKCPVLMFRVCHNSNAVSGIGRKEVMGLRCNIINLRLPFRMLGLYRRGCGTDSSQVPYIGCACSINKCILCICGVGNGTLRPKAFICPFLHFLCIFKIFVRSINPYKVISRKILAIFVSNIISNGPFDPYKIISGKKHCITSFCIIL